MCINRIDAGSRSMHAKHDNACMWSNWSSCVMHQLLVFISVILCECRCWEFHVCLGAWVSSDGCVEGGEVANVF